MISKKISAKIGRVSADTDTRKKREYRPIISAGRYIGRSLVCVDGWFTLGAMIALMHPVMASNEVQVTVLKYNFQVFSISSIYFSDNFLLLLLLLQISVLSTPYISLKGLLLFYIYFVFLAL